MTGVQMKRIAKSVSRLLIVTLSLLPFAAQAGMIGTGEVASGASIEQSRAKVLAFVSRGDVQQQMEALGLSASTARERVNALTDEEVQRIAGKIDAMPAGASSTAAAWTTAGVILFALAIYLLWK